MSINWLTPRRFDISHFKMLVQFSVENRQREPTIGVMRCVASPKVCSRWAANCYCAVMLGKGSSLFGDVFLTIPLVLTPITCSSPLMFFVVFSHSLYDVSNQLARGRCSWHPHFSMCACRLRMVAEQPCGRNSKSDSTLTFTLGI